MWILNMYSLKEWTYYGEISLPAFLTNLPKDVDAYIGFGPGQMFVYTQATHTHLNLSLQMCYPSNRDLVFRTLSFS